MGGLKNATTDSSGDVMTSSNMTENNVNYSRADLVAANDEMALTVIPVMVVLAVMMVIGILGNSLVCYIFCFRLRPSTQNYLIVYLAVFDLLSSTIGMPGEIADMRYIIMYESEAACKILTFLTYFCALGSSFTLVVIAVDRFRKVCRPLQRQLSVKHIKYSLFPIVGATLIYTCPALVLYGPQTIDSGIPGVPGTACFPSDDMTKTLFPVIFNGVLFTSFVVVTTSLMVIYYHVLKETKHHARYIKENPVHNEDSSKIGHSDHNIVTPETSLTTDDIHVEHATPGTPQTCTGSLKEPEIVINMAALMDSHLESQSPGETSERSFKETELEVFAGDASVLKGDYCVKTERVNSLQSENSSTQTDTSLRHSQSTQTNTSLRPIPPESQLCKVPLFHSETNDHVTSHLPSASLNDGGNDVTTTSHNPTSSTSNPGVFSVTPKTTPPCEKKKKTKKSRAQRFQSKTTLIAFLVTLVFILSFLPFLCLQISKLIFKEYDTRLRGAGLVFYHLFFRSFLLNSVLNPFIYGALNAKFNVEVKKLFRHVRTYCKRN